MTAIRSIRWTFVAALVATLFLIPVSVSPAGSVELEGVCASVECKPHYASYCWDQGSVRPDSKRAIIEID
jgi:hypothetical protein